MRAAIFIDGAYLIKQLHEARLVADYSRVAEYLLAPLRKRIPLDLLRCYFYDCPPWVSERATEDERRRMAIHERFVAVLEDLDRWQVRLGKLERRREGEGYTFSQKRVDVQLSVDLVRHAAAGHIQHAVLVAGDSDFIPAVAAAKESGVTLTLWCGRDKSPHKDLMVAADEVQLLDWQQFPRKAMRPVSQSGGGTITGAAAQKAAAVEGSGEGEDGAPATDAPRKKSRRGGRGRRRKNGAQGDAPAGAPVDGVAEVVELAAVRADPEPVLKVVPDAPVEEAPKKGRGRGTRAKAKVGKATEAAEPTPTRTAASAPTRAATSEARTPAATPSRSTAARPPKAVAEDEPGDDIGNRAQPGEGGNRAQPGDGKKRRGRRGGRGRRRGGGGGTPPA